MTHPSMPLSAPARAAASLLVLPLLALTACGGEAPTATNTAASNTAAPAAPEEGFAERVRTLPERQREGVFLRAVRDGKEECQEVTEQYETNPVQGNPAWAVTCDKTNHWVISIDPTGTAIVTKASAASRLPPKAE